jgi:tRNA A37 threonylcarbamoyladenosine modification protein TsaB
VAVLEDDTILEEQTRDAPRRASGAVLEMLSQVRRPVDLYVADLGPGSFTGVKVGVTIAKTLAYAEGVQVAGISSFDLIHPNGSAAVPSRKGKHLVRDERGVDELPNDDPRVIAADKSAPSATNAARLFGWLEIVDPMQLVPNYVLEPSISVPKAPKS